MSTDHLTAFDIKPGQVWRFETTQVSERHNAVVDYVTDDGHVRMFGSDELVTIGALLAYWRPLS